MIDLVQRAVEAAQVAGAEYADARFVDLTIERLGMRNERLETAATSRSTGVGLRVLVGGYWGFASTSRADFSGLDALARRAVAVAQSSSALPAPAVRLAPLEPQRGTYRTPIEQDPFTIPLERKLEVLESSVREMRRDQRVTVAEAGMYFRREEKYFASSEGAALEQTLFESAAGLSATAVEGGEQQVRSYPQSGFAGNHAGAGYEWVEEIDVRAHAARTSEEAVALLSAPNCPDAITTVILDSSQLAIQIHESCGHPTELDRALGTELSFAGGSFLRPGMLGGFRYGSEHVTLVADATVPRGLGTFGWDDEGVPAQRMELVTRGEFTGYLTSRETAPEIGQLSNGTVRAEGWNRLPLIRMTNISLNPGSWRFADLVADTDDGIYMEQNRSWSIDDVRLNFQFGTEVAWEIKGGKLGRMLRNPTYRGNTPQFWASCDAVCGPEDWRLWGVPNCGKGEPMQVVHVGHGAAPARFRKLQVSPGG